MNLRRTLLYVPGNMPGMLQNIPVFEADGVMIDLEDAVPLSEKDAARKLTRNFLSFYKVRNKEMFVRINPLDTEFAAKDLDAVLPALPDGIRLPKADTPEIVERLDTILTEYEERLGLAIGHFKIIPSIESAQGLLNSTETAKASNRLVALAFGAEDYTASMEIDRTRSGEELFHARTRMVWAAKAAGIQAIDTIFADANDMEGLRAETLLAKRLGFTGKSLVNPRQIEVVHETFRPTQEEIDHAVEVMDAIRRAREMGTGVISLRGKMVDAPVVKRAARTLRTAVAFGMMEYELSDEVIHGQNSLGREIPAEWRGRKLDPYVDPWNRKPEVLRATRPLVRRNPGDSKLLPSIRAALEKCDLRDGMNISTHHHLRNGDLLLNLIVKELDAMGLKDIGIASSSVHPVHAELIPYIRKGVITRIETGVNGLIGELVSKGELDCPIVVRSHGGRARCLVTGEVEVDVAFIAAPCCDITGNLNGVRGPSACGSLGYAYTDARYAKKVIAVTDNLVSFPAAPVSISQSDVDYVVQVESLGDPKKIVSTTTRITRDPAGLVIAKYAAEVIDAAGLLKDGFSFQTGSGGISLAVADNIRNKMASKKIKGSFGCGGITGYFVEMLEQGFFETLFDVQCFDLKAVESIGKNAGHREISADLYANPFNRGCVVNMLDAVILGATEVDVNFNVNVNTESNGLLLHNTGGHCDTAAGAKLAIVVAPSMRGRLPIVRDAVTTVTTPGETVDVIVTERGICVADRHEALRKELIQRKLPVKEIHDFHEEICTITGKPKALELDDEVVAVVEYRDGSIIDVVRRVRN